MKRYEKKRKTAFAILLCITVFLMTGCGKAESGNEQTDMEAQPVISEDQQAAPEAQPAISEKQEETSEVQTGVDTGWTKEKMDEVNLKERAELEEKVRAADGISEEEAIAIAQKAMEDDLGEKAKKLKLHIADENYGWKAYLWDISDWDEYKNKGDIGYSIQFDNIEEIEDFDDLFSYECMVNAVDGSICGAFTHQGLIDGNVVRYDH